MEREIVTMRKMSEKSVLHFGMWQNLTVGFLIGAGRSQYLAWVYYNYERITFLDEVLDKNKVRAIPAMKFEELQKYYLEWKGVK